MAKTRLTVKDDIPSTRQELDEKIAELGRQERIKAKIESDMNEDMSQIKKRYEEQAEPVAARIKSLISGIEKYCVVHYKELTDDGKNRTVFLPSGTLSWRKCPPSVRLSKPNKIIEILKEKGLERYIRVNEEVSKDIILAEPLPVAGIKGITIIKEKENLSIEPFEVKLEA